jgi:tetratricopeptide (TPR) repeat protein
MSRTSRMMRGGVVIVSCLTASVAFAQHEGHAALSPEQIGTVKFETSCSPAVKDDFNRGVALLHSFWFPEAAATFEGVLKKDPSCAMAFWGIALSQWGNPFGGLRVTQAVERGRASSDKAKATGSPTPRERGYIDAVATLFTSADPGTQRARVLAYEKAMEAVVRANPSDIEAKIFYALAINQTALPNDKTYAKQLEAAAILEPLYAAEPGHPGLAHYIIHAYDSPPLAPKALDAARRYASIAPAVPHALHMPSHTFTRVGYWKESIETNRASADAARKSSSSGDELHALDYQVYAYLQIAQDKAARAAIDRAKTVVSSGEGATAGAAGAGSFAVAAMPARYALERGAWSEAAALQVHPATTPFTEAMTHFARALGAARSGSPQAAAPDIERIAALRLKLIEMKDPYWPEQLDIQRRVAQAWVAFAEGRKDEAIRELAAAAEAEDATDKSAISPGPLAPARELLGFMLLEAQRPQEALAAFETTMKKEPNRFQGLSGAARAAEAAGQREKASTYYRQLLDLAKTADTERPEIARARAFVAP